MKHTPGPWSHVHKERPMSLGQVSEIHAGGVGLLARVFWREDLYRSDIAEANARLIAAAPELLEACKILKDEIYNLAEEGTLDFEIVKNHQAIRYAEKAIAKAEGKEV